MPLPRLTVVVPRTQKLANDALEKLILDFAVKLATIRILDPACGSGNFLYVALRLLLDLWKEVAIFAAEMGLTMLSPLPGLAPSPEQLYGIEINEYAHELAQATVWIGYLQWLHDNGYGTPREPVLEPLDNIKQMDAILAFDDDGNPVEPEWPEAEVIVGNPPFLGDKKMVGELGQDYVSFLRTLYSGRISGHCDLVTYWFEKARSMIEQGTLGRAGLLATNSIRDGFNQIVLRRIKESGDIFWAISDRDWILDGAAVNISMVAFDDGSTKTKVLDGKVVPVINADLSSDVNLTTIVPLQENSGLCYLGMMKGGPFDISDSLAGTLRAMPPNRNGSVNSDVVRRRIGGQDITARCDTGWIIDFVEMTQVEASEYTEPFNYVVQVVKPVRDAVRDSRMRTKWWLHGRSRPALRSALDGRSRYIVTPEVAKHRVFVWMPVDVIPDHTCHVVARDDDYMFGMLQSHPHVLWALSIGSTLEDRPRYSSSRVFDTFPFPWPPGKEPQDDPHVQAIAAAAKELVELRNAWLDAPDLPKVELKKRTLTNLYNERPDWLDTVHRRLDAAVFDAYGWPHDLTDDEILERLLALNLERAKGQ